MTESELERDFLALVRLLDLVNRERVERLLAGVLSGRVTLTAEEVAGIRAGYVAALADSLPPDPVGEWFGRGQPS